MHPIGEHAKLHAQIISFLLLINVNFIPKKQFHLQQKHLCTICLSKIENIKTLRNDYPLPNTNRHVKEEWLPITKHKKPNKGKYFDRGEFWSPLMNTIMTSSIEDFKTLTTSLKNQTFDFKVTLNNYKTKAMFANGPSFALYECPSTHMWIIWWWVILS